MSRALPQHHCRALSSLCDVILSSVTTTVPWGEGLDDERQRCYGFIEDFSKWTSVDDLLETGVLLDAQDSDTVDKHNYTVKECCASIKINNEQKDAIDYIINLTTCVLKDNEMHLQPYEFECLDISNLVAIQPNVHNHADYLPLHLDQPRNDGFGIVIVTGTPIHTCLYVIYCSA